MIIIVFVRWWVVHDSLTGPFTNYAHIFTEGKHPFRSCVRPLSMIIKTWDWVSEVKAPRWGPQSDEDESSLPELFRCLLGENIYIPSVGWLLGR